LTTSIDRVTTNIDKGTIVSEKPRIQASHWYTFVTNCYLLLCNNFNDALTHLRFFSFKRCEYVVLHNILLEVTRKLSRFSKMACRSKVVGPRWVMEQCSSNRKSNVTKEIRIFHTSKNPNFKQVVLNFWAWLYIFIFLHYIAYFSTTLHTAFLLLFMLYHMKNVLLVKKVVSFMTKRLFLIDIAYMFHWVRLWSPK